ncbi:MAG: DUF5110 domain-containing protein [Clostridia bacterium]|nr:DUF5110 domain-containing protein [Clostridia bacterium]
MHTSVYGYEHAGIRTRLAALDGGIVRITRTRRPAFLEQSSDVVVCGQTVSWWVAAENGQTVLSTGQLEVTVSPSGALTFRNAEGQLLLRELERNPHLLDEKPVFLNRYDDSSHVDEGQSIDGARAWAKPAETWQDRTAYECRQNFVFADGESLYGLGSHEEGYGDLRGRSRLLYQHNMKAVVPVLVSTKGWGILFDMGCLMAFHDDAEGSFLWADCADELDWYFFYGDGSYASLMEKYRLLTGETPMLPRYALGYIQSKERYVDAEEMLAVADEYRHRDVPLDMLVLDWQSWPEGQWGWKTFDPARFPDPTAFIDALHQKDVRFMISVWPSMQGAANQDRQEMLQNGCMLGNRLIYNAFDPKARELYWKQANEHLFVHGVDAWWCDCTEPFESDWKGTVKPEPLRRAQMNTDEAKQYLDPAKINLYSLFHSQGIYHGQRSVRQDKRVCNLTRSSYAGQHRYATVTWSGDVSATWETLRRQLPEGLHFCATGEGWWSTDVGGFFPNGDWEQWFCDGDFDRGVEDPGYRELFVRWMQLAVFLPMMRAHGTVTPREIWRFGEKGEPFYDAIEKAIRLRYRLVPYLYTLMAENNRKGIPMLRVPALVYPQDPALRGISDQLLLGDRLLAKPVTRPMRYLPGGVPVAEPQEGEQVTLPAGYDWYEQQTGLRHVGGQTVTVHAPLDAIPLFVRAGTILPWGADAPSTAAQRELPLELIVYPGCDGSFILYDDAGDGYGYESGEWASIAMRWCDAERTLYLSAMQGGYPGMPSVRRLLVHCVGEGVREIRYTGQEMKVSL